VATRDTIVAAACETLAAHGLSTLTVAHIARAARVSSALVHYHFATKQRLLAAAAEQLAARRTAGRTGPLRAGGGLSSLDTLWLNLYTGADRGAERAWHDLVLLARDDADIRAVLARERTRERAATAAALPRLRAALGSRPSIPADELAAVVVGLLDGAALALASGASRAEVRAAYDAFWLALVTLGQSAPPS
jgi:AcrR family transcriptional regulator